MMRYFVKLLLTLTLAGMLCCGVAAAQTVSVLPNAMTQFVDGNGAPYAGGHVYMYVPGTTTPKATYQTPQGTSPNANPITLDANGRAVIWGSGEYRQVLQDVYGVVEWDQLTFASPLTSTANGAIWYGTATGTANAITLSTVTGFTGVDGQEIGFIAAATNTSSGTVNASGYGSVLLEKNTSTGLTVLTGGEITIGGLYYATYSKTANVFILQSPTPAAATISSTYSSVVTNSNGAYAFAPLLDGAAFGTVGDGVTDNTSAFTTLFAAAVQGGRIHLACGTYFITKTPSVTIAAGAHVEFAGDGSDCTTVAVQGAINGPTFVLTNQWSSVAVKDLTIATDQAGGTNCLVWSGTFTNANPALAAGNSVENVTLRGMDTYGAATEYCGGGFVETSITNIAVVNLTSNGIAARAGIPISLSGTAAANSDHINISHSNIDACATAVYYGDYVQGVQMTLDNVTGCTNGVVTTASTTTSLSGLLVSSSQFDTFNYGINILDAAFPNLQISNNQFIVEPSGVGVKVQGSNWVIDKSNHFDGHTSTGNTGVIVDNVSGSSNGGNLSGQFVGLSLGIHVTVNYTATVKIDTPYFQNNTADYSLAGSTTIVHDDYPRTLSVITAQIPCGVKTFWSEALQDDAGGSPSYNATATAPGGGNNVVPVVCNGTNWTNH